MKKKKKIIISSFFLFPSFSLSLLFVCFPSFLYPYFFFLPLEETEANETKGERKSPRRGVSSFFLFPSGKKSPSGRQTPLRGRKKNKGRKKLPFGDEISPCFSSPEGVFVSLRPSSREEKGGKFFFLFSSNLILKTLSFLN